MDFQGILILLLIFIGASTFVAYWSSKKSNKKNELSSKNLKGAIERFGFCTKTPNGWSYWVLQISGESETVTILPHLHENHNEIALSKIGDQIELKCYVNHKKDGNELIATTFVNISFRK